MGKMVHTSLPVLTDKLLQSGYFNLLAEETDRRYRAQQKHNYDKRHKASSLRPLEPDQSVWIRNMNQYGAVTGRH